MQLIYLMAYDVAIGHLRGRCMAYCYVVKIVVNFYKVRYEHIKVDVAGHCTCVCVSNSLVYVSAKNRTKNR